MQPRDHRAAGRAAGMLAIVGAAVTAAFCWTGSPPVPQVILTLCCSVLIAAAGVHLYRRDHHQNVLWAVLPFLALIAVVALDFVSHDHSVSAQVFLFFPVLYAASQLRPPGAIAVTAFAVLADATVVFSMDRFDVAITDLGYVAAALVTTSALLVKAGIAQGKLVGKLEEQAAVDPLTGLATRRVLDQAARSALSGTIRGEGTALILFDVDDFKLVNDRYGHPGGDAVLTQIAAVFLKSCRSGDIVSRIGGDEIALLLPGCSAMDAEQRAVDLLRAVEQMELYADSGEPIAVTATAGFAHSPSQARDLAGLYAAADQGLYHAKRQGKARVGRADSVARGRTR